MDTRKVAAEHRLKHWTRVMQDRAASGMSIKAFCEEIGVHENVYYYWQRKLREKACELGMLQNEESTTEAQLISQGFAEIKLRPLLADRQHKSSISQIHVEYAGMRLSTDCTCPAGYLSILLKELVRL